MKKQKVLIVEDDVWLAQQYVRVLEKNGYTVQASPNAHSAIDAVDDFKPDVLMLDVLLPGSTAFALLHELQTYTDTNKIPVVLCTNLAGEIKLSDVEHYGVRRILDKTTMEPEDVAVAIRSVL